MCIAHAMEGLVGRIIVVWLTSEIYSKMGSDFSKPEAKEACLNKKKIHAISHYVGGGGGSEHHED